MFTGLVEQTAMVKALTPREGGAHLLLRADFADDCREGESIAVNGCCLTAAAPPASGLLEFDLLEETLRRTNLGTLEPGRLVNLERALPATGRLGGHFVQGHIDCTAPILSWEPDGADYRLEIALPPQFSQYIIEKGSIAVDGISLTVAALSETSFTIWIIPHTLTQTNLSQAIANRPVNLEFDILAKYVERIVKPAN